MENDEDEDRFPEFFDLLMTLEGKEFTNNKYDRGGKTKFGITEKAWGGPVENLTIEQAQTFFKKEHYVKVKKFFDKETHYNYFDLSVNSGHSIYIKALQSVEEIYDFRKKWFQHCSTLPDQMKNLKGWLNRLSRIQSHFNAN